MAIYNASLLISASNATYFTNVTGGIAAVAVRGFNDTWISSSALLTGSNTFVGNQIISGNVDINGTITASLQTGYLYVGNGSGKTQAVATSSIIANTDTGSLLVTGSVSGNTLTFTKGDASTFNLSVATGSTANIDTGSFVTTASFNSYTSSNDQKVNSLIAATGSYVTSAITASSLVTASAVGNTITFTKGDASTFNLSVATGSTANIDTGSFATTGSNTFTGNQYIYSTSGATPLVISSSAYYGIELVNQGLKISGNGGPRLAFPNDMWFNGNVADDMQLTGDTDNPNTRGIDFFLYGTGSRAMRFRNNSGTSATMEFSSHSGSMAFTANNNNMSLNAGGTISITGSQTNINGLRYPQTDGTNGQALITNGSGILSFGNVSINTGSFATTGSNTFTGNQTITTAGNTQLNIISTDASGQANLDFQAPNANFRATGLFQINNNGQYGGSGSIQILTKDNNMTFAADQGFRFGVTNGVGNGIDPSGFVTINVPSGSQQLQLTGSLVVQNTLTASLQEGYAWVGGTGNISTLVATSSFGSGGSFATLGANTFTGSQTILNAVLNLTNTGSAFWTMLSPTQNNLLFQSPNTVFTSYGDFNFNNNGGMGGSGSLVFTAASNSVQITGSNGTFIQGLKYPNTDGTAGQVITTNGSGILSFTTVSGGATGSFATLGANLFTGSQTIQSGSKILFNGTGTGGDANGLDFGSGNATLYYTAGGTNFLQFVGTNAGIDFSTAGSNNNLNFRTTGTSGQIQFTSNSSSISLTSATTTTISSSTTNIYSPSSVGGGINNRGVVTIGQNIGTGFGESYLLGYSGSLVLGNSANSATYAALSHISVAQPNGLSGLIFKSNSNTGATIVSGSANIFTNPNTPTTGYTRYIGGSNNLYLNNSNGVTSQITSSAASVSGVRPVMNNNIFNGTGNFTINQANNPGTHTYSHNTISGVGTTFINALAFTGSLNLLSNLILGGGLTANPASASIAEIASGLSGSGTVTMNNNGIFGGGITSTSPRALGTAQTQITSNNVVAGTSITVTNISSSFAVAASQNITNNTMLYTNAAASAIHTSAGQMSQNQGAVQINAIGSAVGYSINASLGAPVITNQFFSGSVGGGLMSANRNLFQGQLHNLIVTGSVDAGAGNVNMSDNAVLGKQNTIFINATGAGVYNAFNACVVGGQNLIITGSNSFNLSEGGGGYFGRYNANDGIRNRTGENVFLVGTGVSGSRKTGFLIDSGSNSFFEGSLNVSGSTSMTGSLLVTSFTTLASVSSSLNFADDTAAAAGGVPLGGLYRNGNFVMIRLT